MPLIVTPGKLNQRAELYHQLGSMLSAGIPLILVVEQAQANLPDRASRKALARIHRHLLEGDTFAEAMASRQWMVPGIRYCSPFSRGKERPAGPDFPIPGGLL